MDGQWRRTLKVLFWVVYLPFGCYVIGKYGHDIIPFLNCDPKDHPHDIGEFWLLGAIVSFTGFLGGGALWLLMLCTINYIKGGEFSIP